MKIRINLSDDYYDDRDVHTMYFNRDSFTIFDNDGWEYEYKYDEVFNITNTSEHIVRCKNCKYFEQDQWGKAGNLPLIVAHCICKKWGNGCCTDKDGYCFLGEEKGD